jgi:hypothetical protein
VRAFCNRLIRVAVALCWSLRGRILEFVSRLRSWSDDETGRIGPPLLLALVGGLVGGPLGVLVAALLFDVMCGVGPPGSLENAEACGLEGLLLLLVCVPLGVASGVILGAVVGSRQPSHPVPVPESAVSMLAEPPVHREATAGAWVAVVAGVTMSYGAFVPWRSVTFPSSDLDRYGNVLMSGPEGLGYLGGLLVLLAGVLRVLRPAAHVPTFVIGVGACLSAVGLVWGLVDLFGVPSGLERHLFMGYWFSVGGTILGLVAWLVDPRVRGRSVGGLAGAVQGGPSRGSDGPP